MTLEKQRDQKRQDYFHPENCPADGWTQEKSFDAGFDAAIALMREREAKLIEALKKIESRTVDLGTDFEIDHNSSLGLSIFASQVLAAINEEGSDEETK